VKGHSWGRRFGRSRGKSFSPPRRGNRQTGRVWRYAATAPPRMDAHRSSEFFTACRPCTTADRQRDRPKTYESSWSRLATNGSRQNSSGSSSPCAKGPLHDGAVQCRRANGTWTAAQTTSLTWRGHEGDRERRVLNDNTIASTQISLGRPPLCPFFSRVGGIVSKASRKNTGRRAQPKRCAPGLFGTKTGSWMKKWS